MSMVDDSSLRQRLISNTEQYLEQLPDEAATRQLYLESWKRAVKK